MSLSPETSWTTRARQRQLNSHNGEVKARLGILIGVVCLFSGCVAIPPLVTVQHRGGTDDSSLKTRVEALERRVNELEDKPR